MNDNIYQCLDDPSTDKPTTRHFDPHYPSTQRSVFCDNVPLRHSYTYTIRPGIFLPPRFRSGQFVTCNMMSTPYFLSCDKMSNSLLSEMWTLCHITHVLPRWWVSHVQYIIICNIILFSHRDISPPPP